MNNNINNNNDDDNNESDPQCACSKYAEIRITIQQ